MDTFIIWISAIAAICIGIVVLALFFTALNVVKDRFSSSKFVKIKQVLNNSELVTVHLSSGKTLSDLKFVGFADPSSFKGGVPYQLANMVVFESVDGRRILLRADAIRIMEEQAKTLLEETGRTD